MDLPRLAVRLSAACAVALLVAVVVLPAQHGGDVAAFAVTDKSGVPLPVPDAPTVEAAQWNFQPVLVFVVPAAELDAVDAARGAGSATPSIELPGHPDLRLFVLSARSTHLGCTVVFSTRLGSSRDIPNYLGDVMPGGRILDPCHYGQWDAFRRAQPLAGTPAPARLPGLDVRIVSDRIEGTGFDGPAGPQRR